LPRRICESCGGEMSLLAEIFNERGFVIQRRFECPSCRTILEEKPAFAYRGAIG